MLSTVISVIYPFVGIILTCILLTQIWKRFVKVTLLEVKGGYKENITLPHTEAVELYFADISSNSMRVRFCLAAANVDFKANFMKLPAAGSFETKSKEYLDMNPAGTVPLLVHNGHPVHDSADQLVYIAENLVKDEHLKLIPTDLEELAVCRYWVDETSLYASELEQGMEEAIKIRVGNLIPVLSLPILPVIFRHLSWKQLFQNFWILGVSGKQILYTIFGVLGVKAFQKLPKLAELAKEGKKVLLGHLTKLENHLQARQSTYINGENVSIADMGWSPILGRLDLAGWWAHIDKATYPCVFNYWENMRSLDAYKDAVRPIEAGFLIDEIKESVGKWKEQYPWYNSLYE